MALFKYGPEDALRGPFAVDEWRPDIIAEYLGLLSPHRCLVFVASSDFAGAASAPGAQAKGWRTEKWYKASFREEAIDEARLAKWHTQASEEAATSGLRVPELNRFVPSDFSLRGDSAALAEDAAPERRSKSPVQVTPPSLLASSDFSRLWHKLDLTFKTPRAYVAAYAHLPAYDLGPRSVVLMRLFCNVVCDDLNAWAYDASVAGLGYTLVSAGGFNDKLPELLEVMLGRMHGVLVDCEEAGADGADQRGQELMDKLEVQRQLLIQDYKNFTREEPWSVSSYYASQLMLRGSWHLDDYLEALEQPINLAELAASVRAGCATAHVEALVHGNSTVEESRRLQQQVVSAVQNLGVAAPLRNPLRRKVTELPVGSETVFEYDLASQNRAQENSCTQNIYQVGPTGVDARRDAALALICHMAGTSAYQSLRTEEQLGYLVQAGLWLEQHVVGLTVLVQGNRLAPHEADARIEAWLRTFMDQLEQMPADEFANNVRAVVSERTQRYVRLAQETQRHWFEIQSRQYRFDRVVRSVEALGALSQADVVEVFREHLAAGAPRRRKLSMRIIGTSAGGARTPAPTLSTLQDLRAFRDAAAAFPDPVTAPLPEVARRDA